ncbi:hypothetical protein B0H17DRAFT_951113, partial [Mycena rosella]
LLPSDLLAWARTSKPLRSFLMSEARSHRVWARSFSNISGSIPCPPDLHLPAYAALCYSKTCQVSPLDVYQRSPDIA